MPMKMYITREAETLARAAHKNVVHFLGLEQPAEMYHKVLVMEYCSEGSLIDMIKAKPTGLTAPEFIQFTKNVHDVMQHLWEKNIIHRDIKPSNILISKDNSGQTIYKLADFGAARFLNHNETYRSLYGTFDYSHPDIIGKMFLGIEPPSPYSYNNELWPIGAMFYQAATGQLPFSQSLGKSDPLTMYKMTTEKKPGCISAKEQNGEIEFSQGFPNSCELNESLKQIYSTFLAGLLEVSIHFI